MSDGRISHHFGDEPVMPNERERRIRQVFEAVAPRYDLMNDLMSFGIHRLWKRTLVRLVNAQPGERIVDLAGGTGDVARALAAPGREVINLDASLGMLRAGRRHAGVRCLAGKGETLPLADASVDTLTIAFGMRNMTRMEAALGEIYRVLRPGGRLLCMEFSRPAAPIRPFYNAFSRLVIPRLGAWVAGQPSAYAYLIESIRRFPDQEEFKAILETAGFREVRYRNLSFGIAAIHVARKGNAEYVSETDAVRGARSAATETYQVDRRGSGHRATKQCAVAATYSAFPKGT